MPVPGKLITFVLAVSILLHSGQAMAFMAGAFDGLEPLLLIAVNLICILFLYIAFMIRKFVANLSGLAHLIAALFVLFFIAGWFIFSQYLYSEKIFQEYAARFMVAGLSALLFLLMVGFYFGRPVKPSDQQISGIKFITTVSVIFLFSVVAFNVNKWHKQQQYQKRQARIQITSPSSTVPVNTQTTDRKARYRLHEKLPPRPQSPQLGLPPVSPTVLTPPRKTKEKN